MYGIWGAKILGANGRGDGRTVVEVHNEVTIRNSDSLHDASNLCAQRIAPARLTLSNNTAAARPDGDACKQCEGRAIKLKLQIILNEHDSAKLFAHDGRERGSVFAVGCHGSA